MNFKDQIKIYIELDWFDLVLKSKINSRRIRYKTRCGWQESG